ncbi:MAG: VPLPA-CTERM sorting domain-containing protein [Roseobacter sp.]
MNFRALATAVCLSLTTATASFAAPINVNFSFTDADGLMFGISFPSTVTGVIEGLDSDGLGQQATRITAKSDLANFDYVFTSFGSNTFDVSAGIIDMGTVRVSAASANTTLGEPGQLDWRGADSHFSLFESVGLYFFGFPLDTDASEITFTSDFTPAAVPLPAGGLLLMSGMVGIAALKRRKKRAA